MLDPAFLRGRHGRIHCTFFRPEAVTPTGVLFLPPFAEEMNKSRRMMARLGHALADRRWVMALPDPFGTGDSEGDFAEADWAAWRDDVLTTAEALVERGVERLVVGGLRTGVLLALAVLDRLPVTPERLLFWQPVTSGQQFLTRFLRLRLAASMTGGERESTGDLRARLDAGEALEIAGYELSPALARALDELDAKALVPPASVPVDWIEVSGGREPRVSPAGTRVAEVWREAGCEVMQQAVAGDPFWTTQEIVDVPELVERSVERLVRS